MFVSHTPAHSLPVTNSYTKILIPNEICQRQLGRNLVNGIGTL